MNLNNLIKDLFILTNVDDPCAHPWTYTIQNRYETSFRDFFFRKPMPLNYAGLHKPEAGMTFCMTHPPVARCLNETLNNVTFWDDVSISFQQKAQQSQQFSINHNSNNSWINWSWGTFTNHEVIEFQRLCTIIISNLVYKWICYDPGVHNACLISRINRDWYPPWWVALEARY